MKLSIQSFLFLTGSLAPIISGDKASPSAIQCAVYEFQLDLTTDNYGDETSWSLGKQGMPLLVASGPPTGEVYADNTAYVEKACIDQGCYDFIISDSYGDGLCCGYGLGSIVISLDGELIDQLSGEFQNQASTSFCTLDVPCDGIVFQLDLTTDYYGSETSWILRDQDNGNEVAFGPSVEDYASSSTYVETACINPGCYDLVIFDYYGDGLTSGSGGSIVVSLDGELVDEVGGEFGFETAISFCTSDYTCQDSLTLIAFGGDEYTCAQAAESCTNQKVASHCPFTCNACSNYECADSQMKWKANSRTFDCTMLSDYEGSCNYDFPVVASTCRESCNYCSLDE